METKGPTSESASSAQRQRSCLFEADDAEGRALSGDPLTIHDSFFRRFESKSPITPPHRRARALFSPSPTHTWALAVNLHRPTLFTFTACMGSPVGASLLRLPSPAVFAPVPLRAGNGGHCSRFPALSLTCLCSLCLAHAPLTLRSHSAHAPLVVGGLAPTSLASLVSRSP